MLKIGILKQMRGNNFKDKEIGKKIKKLWCEALKELELQDKTTLKKIFYMGFILSMKVIIRETILFL